MSTRSHRFGTFSRRHATGSSISSTAGGGWKGQGSPPWVGRARVVAAGVRAGTAVAVCAVVALAAAADAAPEDVHLLTCQQRIEGGGPIPRPAARRDLVVGRIAFSGLARRAGQPLGPKHGRYWTVKAAPVVRAGAPVVVTVTPSERPHVRLAFPGGDADTVRFAPCEPSHPAWGYEGTVGRYTAWAGGFLTDAPRCARIVVTSAGRTYRGRVPLGRRCP